MIAPLFLPHLGCGRRCTYCNQDHITGGLTGGLEERIVRLFASLKGRAEIGLYGGNVLGLPPPELEAVLSLLDPYRDKVTSIRISAKPGPLGPEVTGILKKYNVRTIELGAPAFNNDILARIGRGHTAEDVRDTYRFLRAEGFETGLQVMVGLPGETARDVRETAANIVSLAPAFVRIYPLLVMEDTDLCRDFREGRFFPDTRQAAVAKSVFIHVSAWTHGIGTIKIGLTTNDVLLEKIVAGPFHPAFGYLVKSEAFRLALAQRCASSGFSGRVSVSLNRRDVAHLVGYRGENLDRLAESGISPVWVEEAGLEEGHFIVGRGSKKVKGSLADALYSFLSPDTPS
jgi:histone acetyltransferase (RNA polymerase elongator complex component)